MFSRTIVRVCSKNNAIVYANAFSSHFRSCSQEINVVKSKIPDVSIPNVLVHEYMWENVDKWHDKTALVSFLFLFIRLVMKIRLSSGVRAKLFLFKSRLNKTASLTESFMVSVS